MQLFELSSLIGMGDKQKEGEHCIRGKIADFEINRRCLSCTRGLSQLRRSFPLTSCFQRAMHVCLMLCMSVPAFCLFYAMHAWGSHHGETESEILDGLLWRDPNRPLQYLGSKAAR